MYNKIKNNILIIAATLFLGLTLAVAYSVQAQTSGGCQSCGGRIGSSDCYDVNVGAISCSFIGDNCYNDGECENGTPILKKA